MCARSPQNESMNPKLPLAISLERYSPSVRGGKKLEEEYEGGEGDA